MRSAFSFAGWATALACLFSSSATAADFEQAVDLGASDVLPSDFVTGADYRIDARVQSDGYLNYYTLSSRFGAFEAVGGAQLRQRVGEIEALAALEELSKTEVFLQAAADAGIAQIKTIQTFATRPVATVTGIPSGIGRMFKRFGRQAQDVAEEAEALLESDGDGEDSGESADSESSGSKAVRTTESFLGVTDSQRAWARKLGTDPYSDNEVLQQAIKDFAWAERLGTLGMGVVGIPRLPGADIVAEVNDVVWSKDAGELAELNRSLLVATGADEELIERYLDNARMTPSQQTLLTAAIAEMVGVEGRDGILRLALNTETDVETRFFIQSVTLLAGYHTDVNPLARILANQALPSASTADGRLVLAVASDHIYWTESVALAAERFGADATGEKELWHTGTLSGRCSEELSEAGWQLTAAASAERAEDQHGT